MDPSFRNDETTLMKKMPSGGRFYSPRTLALVLAALYLVILLLNIAREKSQDRAGKPPDAGGKPGRSALTLIGMNGRGFKEFRNEKD